MNSAPFCWWNAKWMKAWLRPTSHRRRRRRRRRLTLRQFASLKSESKAHLNYPKRIRTKPFARTQTHTHKKPPHCCVCNLKVKWLQSHSAPRQLQAEQTAFFFLPFFLDSPPSAQHFFIQPLTSRCTLIVPHLRRRIICVAALALRHRSTQTANQRAIFSLLSQPCSRKAVKCLLNEIQSPNQPKREKERKRQKDVSSHFLSLVWPICRGVLWITCFLCFW